MPIFDEGLLPILLLTVSTCVHELLVLLVGDLVAVHPKRVRPGSLLVGRDADHAGRNRIRSLQSQLHVYAAKGLVDGCESFLYRADAIVAPVWDPIERQWSLAQKLPLLQIVTGRVVVGDVDLDQKTVD